MVRAVVPFSANEWAESQSFRFRLVGAENNLRHYIAAIPILQMSKLSPRDETCLVCAHSALSLQNQNAGLLIPFLGLVFFQARLLFNSMD